MVNAPNPPDLLPPGLEPGAPVTTRSWPAQRPLMTLAGLGLTAGLLLFAGFLAFVASLSRQESEFGRTVDGIVALTGGADRIGDALAVLREGRAQRLLISGVNIQTSRASLIRQSGNADLFDCCVDIGRAALNTVGNAIEAADWSRRNRYRSLILVTSNYHMPRALVEVKRHLKGVEIIPHPVIVDPVRIENWWREPGLFRLLFVEYAKYVAAELRSRLIPDNPPPG